MLAIPVLTGSAAYALAEAFRWRAGLDEKPSDARPFYAVIAVATLIGMLMNFAGINPIDALVLTAVLNGLLAPPLLVLVMLASNDRRIMGERTNGRVLNLLGWATTVVMAVAAVALIGTTLLG